LTTAVEHLLRASQQGLMLPFFCRSSASIVSFPDIIKLAKLEAKGCHGDPRTSRLPWNPTRRECSIVQVENQE
jgi:hypothetical protein